MLLFNLFHKHFCRFESRDFVLRNDDCRILGNVSCSFFRTNFYDETTKTTEIDIFAVCL